MGAEAKIGFRLWLWDLDIGACGEKIIDRTRMTRITLIDADLFRLSSALIRARPLHPRSINPYTDVKIALDIYISMYLSIIPTGSTPRIKSVSIIRPV
jgi:hypothetical protein